MRLKKCLRPTFHVIITPFVEDYAMKEHMLWWAKLWSRSKEAKITVPVVSHTISHFMSSEIRYYSATATKNTTSRNVQTKMQVGKRYGKRRTVNCCYKQLFSDKSWVSQQAEGFTSFTLPIAVLNFVERHGESTLKTLLPYISAIPEDFVFRDSGSQLNPGWKQCRFVAIMPALHKKGECTFKRLVSLSLPVFSETF